MKAKVRNVSDEHGEPLGWMIWCPACECGHLFKNHIWEFNGSYEHPSFYASMLVKGYDKKTQKPLVCHSFVEWGNIRFLADSTHKLAGKTVALEEF